MFLILQFPPSPQQVGLPSPQVTAVPFEFYKSQSQPARLPLPTAAMISKQVQVSILKTNYLLVCSFICTGSFFDV